MHKERLTDSFQDRSVKFHCALKISFDGTQIDFAILSLDDRDLMLVVLPICAGAPIRPSILCVQVDFNSKLILEFIG